MEKFPLDKGGPALAGGDLFTDNDFFNLCLKGEIYGLFLIFI
jgi:hypothetical protein